MPRHSSVGWALTRPDIRQALVTVLFDTAGLAVDAVGNVSRLGTELRADAALARDQVEHLAERLSVEQAE
jgi:hypothetical protein